jgi:ribonuclease VapC
LAEIASKFSDWGTPESQLREFLGAINIAVLPFDAVLAYETGPLREATRPYGLSLGDRARLATARQFGVPAVTADRTLAEAGCWN